MLLNKYFSSIQQDSLENQEQPANSEMESFGESVAVTIDRDFHIELEQIKLEKLKIQEEQLECRQKMMMLKLEKQPVSNSNTMGGGSSRRMLPDGKIIVQNHVEKTPDADKSFTVGAGDSNETTCSCQKSWAKNAESDEGSSTPSTCILCSDDRSPLTQSKRNSIEKSETSKVTDLKTSEYSSKVVPSRTTDITVSRSKQSEYSKDVASKRSQATSKRCELRKCACNARSDMTCDWKLRDFYSDSDDEADETNRLIQLRNSDYLGIVDDNFKLVIALAGYPKSKMRLRHTEVFQSCLTDVINMQLKANLLRKVPSFLDYYLNRGALVCICKDEDTRDWVVRVSPGLQERMCTNLVLLNTKVKRLGLATLKIPRSAWPATAQDCFKLLQYFNPSLKTSAWKIYSQKVIDDVECTSFLIDRVSAEIIRGPSFKNVMDYDQMDFELTGYTEIYYECMLAGMEEDLSSVASRVKLLEELKTATATPRIASTVSIKSTDLVNPLEVQELTVKAASETVSETKLVKADEYIEEPTDINQEVIGSQDEVLTKIKDVEYIGDKDEVLVWSEETVIGREGEIESDKPADDMEENNTTTTSLVAMSEKSESVAESIDNLLIKASTINIDSNRGIAYHRRTNYLHVENELKVAITLEGYPQNKLEGTHIRRLKHLFKEYLHKDMKSQRFPNLIIPKFQDIYLSNGAVIYICDSLETRDYLTEVLPKFINSTGLKLAFRDITNLVRYTRLVMRLPKEMANVESIEILSKLQEKYQGLKPDCWKYYSDVAGKQKRQFGVDPESLDIIKNPDFDPVFQGEKLIFRIIDRQKRDVSCEESSKNETIEDEETRKQRLAVVKNMYMPIDREITNSPLTRIRTNHYSDLIADDLKLYVGPVNYPDSRIDEPQFHSIKTKFENIVMESLEKGNMSDESIPKFHDMYLFDGVIFIICQCMESRLWIENNVNKVNEILKIKLKSTEFRGAVGIISMTVRTNKDTDGVITELQEKNPRLRTKYWRIISTVTTGTKLDGVLQIDKLSAQVILEPNFNKLVGCETVEFKLGHLQSLIKPKSSLEALTQGRKKSHSQKNEKKPKKSSKASKKKNKSSSVVSILSDKHYQIEETEISENELDESPKLKRDQIQKELNIHDLDPVIIEPETESFEANNDFASESFQSKIILKIPLNILPDSEDDLNIIFDILEDKNPGLNTEIWQVFTETPYPSNGKFILYVDKQSLSVIENKDFDSSVGGVDIHTKHTLNSSQCDTQLNIPGLQRVGRHTCNDCGAAADLYCARCEIVPYCSTQCQRRDWNRRHKAVCHNLMRLSSPGAEGNEPTDDIVDEGVPPPPAPLRRPHSPSARSQPQRDRSQPANNYKDKKARFVPPNHQPQSAAPVRNSRGFQNRSHNQDGRRSQSNDDQDNAQDEEWGEKKAPEAKPVPKPVTPKQDIKTEVPTKQAPATIEPAIKPEGKMAANLSTPKPQVQKMETALVPAQYLVEKLPIGESFLLSVDHPAENCATKQPGFICLVLHTDYQDQYNLLLEDIFDSEAAYMPRPGSTFAYLDPSDGGWYRARCLSPTRAALLDSGKVVPLSPADQCRSLAKIYEQIPEFCCVLTGPVELGMSLKCTVLMKTGYKFAVSVDKAGEDSYLGEGSVTRWLPTVETPTPAPIEKPQTLAAPVQPPQPKEDKPQPVPSPKPESKVEAPAPVKTIAPKIPEVTRPAIVNNGRYFLMHVTSLKRACVRPCTAESTEEFEGILQDVLLYGMQKSKQLSSPPQPGELVLCLFEDIHYRALVRRTKAKDNRYMVEYVEYGNEEVVGLEKLYNCPPELDLTSRPAQASIVQLSTIGTAELTQPALEYIDGVKELAELIAKIPGGTNTTPSGSLVDLVQEKNSESINKKLEEMCTPEWKKLEEGGGDVLDSAVMLFSQMKTHPLPTDREFDMDVTDFNNIIGGLVCGFLKGDKLADYIYGPLTEKINEYCKSELCSEPYLPMVEELCLARLPPYPQWFRAVVIEHRPGSATATVLFTDYGNVEAAVPVKDLRKCMPEFCKDPALAATADIKNWPKPATKEQIVCALEFLQVNDEGRGSLHVKSCERVPDDLSYIIEVPELIAAINSV